ncbi:MAG: hypothetical protein COV99_12340 [Bacteroidetes bacterium CG12_big_fil_rev_8_21_14_0_65_60_17]|nr:MAG: hypothetical protein COV99_12340 [Bacteroidetes bacterium CG12_big_fil_rev_8_21_14_0_65_60_17]
MSNLVQNILILGFCWLLATGGGAYLTLLKQPAEMSRLEKAEEVARLKAAEMNSLLGDVSASESLAGEAMTRWQARYKSVPGRLSSEDVIRFLNEHTSSGFDPFDITFKAHRESRKFNRFDFDIKGRADWPDLYSLIWSIENSPVLYRVTDLELQASADAMIEFNFELTAFYGGMTGMSADERESLPEIPASWFPSPSLADNPFEPLVLSELPPNTDDLVDVERAELAMIAGGQAVFFWNDSYVGLEPGDKVYLGTLISVDPREGRVVVRLNRGGITDEIELMLDTGASYRQAIGPVRLAPSRKQ